MFKQIGTSFKYSGELCFSRPERAALPVAPLFSTSSQAPKLPCRALWSSCGGLGHSTGVASRGCLLLLVKSPHFPDLTVLALLATFITGSHLGPLASASLMRWLPDQAIYFYWNSDGSEAPLVYGLVAGNRARWCSDQSSCHLIIAIPSVLG